MMSVDELFSRTNIEGMVRIKTWNSETDTYDTLYEKEDCVHTIPHRISNMTIDYIYPSGDGALTIEVSL